ncbi:hypothetical protein STIAU_4447 [Stigmatella aurantiaca DW4/3-1]|uniref:Uncharacterized protein n=1 Tax=Stigmatella aurantiaca (strain DW4/3-1) TaxID=378806 RepID=Q08VV9_STIAD|nr:hypothetical protein STIAU_4447 [Stigmatella aurantiaca DW4/3-1]
MGSVQREPPWHRRVMGCWRAGRKLSDPCFQALPAKQHDQG